MDSSQLNLLLSLANPKGHDSTTKINNSQVMVYLQKIIKVKVPFNSLLIAVLTNFHKSLNPYPFSAFNKNNNSYKMAFNAKYNS